MTVPTRDEQEELLRRYTIPYSPEEHFRVASEIVERNMPFIYNIALKYVRRGIEFEDAMQVATMGMHKAIERFDLSKGCALTTYSQWWIRAALNHFMRRHSRTIRIPSQMWERRGTATKALKADHRAQLTTRQRAALDAFAETETCSVETPVAISGVWADRSFTILDKMASTDETQEHSYAREEAKAILMRAMKSLKRREFDIISKRFGLAGDAHTLEEVGDLYGLSRERIRQLEELALDTLFAAMHRLGYAR